MKVLNSNYPYGQLSNSIFDESGRSTRKLRMKYNPQRWQLVNKCSRISVVDEHVDVDRRREHTKGSDLFKGKQHVVS